MTDWNAMAGRPAVAEAVGPFPLRPFLEAWWRHRGTGTLHLVEHGSSVAAVVVDDGVMSFAGDSDVTDYHAPLGPDPGGVMAAAVAGAPARIRFRFDSMPGEVARPVAAALSAGGVTATIARHEAAMVVTLEPGDPFGALDRKQRHEVRRKQRRFTEALGEPNIATGPDGFEAFATMHRMAGGLKGEFLSDAMEAFFRDLLAVPGATVDVLLSGAGDPVAAAFGFVDDGGYYLYNSSFDPAAAAASPGIVMIGMLMERESSVGRSRFDLLKGADVYKSRLGAVPRELFVIEGVV